MDYYLVTRKKSVSSPKKRQLDHKCMLLGKRSQSEKAMCCRIPITRHSGKLKTMRMLNRSVVAKGSKERQG